MAEVLRLLGISRAMVVHGSGLDEITTTGNTIVSELSENHIRSYTISCDTFGIASAQLPDLAGGDAGTNARIVREILGGEHGAGRDIVLLNAGAAIYVGGGAGDLPGRYCPCSSIDRFRMRPRAAGCTCRCYAGFSMILDEIVRRSKQRAALLPATFPEPPSCIHASLAGAIREKDGKNAVIAEIKCTSPSGI